ncbi:MAG: glycosyltransferase [Desulfosoma sp.]
MPVITICDVIQFHSPLSGGIKRYVTDKARFVKSLKDVSHCVIVPGSEDRLEVFGKSRFYFVRSLPMVGAVGYRLLLSRWKILDILRKEKPHVIEIGDPYYSAWVALAYGEKSRTPTVGYYHSDFPRALDRTVKKYFGSTTARMTSFYIHGYLSRLYRRMDAVVAATRRGRDALGHLGVRTTRIIPLGVDLEIFHPRREREEFRRTLGISASGRLILYVGRLAREKNVSSLVPMMDRLNGNGVPAVLCIVGDGELRKKLCKAAARRSYIRMMPYCRSMETLARIYSAADLCVYPGTSETFGYVSVEAQACGTRVLVVQGGGAEETVKGEDPCYLARSSNPEDLAQAAALSLTTPESEETRRMRHYRIADRFPWHRTFEQLLTLYRELADKDPISWAA